MKSKLKKLILINKNLFNKGFTLIEIMVVIAILGILAGLIVPKLVGNTDEARKIAVKQDIATIASALKMYRLDNSHYPTSEQGLSALVHKPNIAPMPKNWRDGGYLEKIPKDPWGKVYQYLSPGLHSDADIFTFGADNEAGGEGINADIGNWE